jgi:hypothetical protein
VQVWLGTMIWIEWVFGICGGDCEIAKEALWICGDGRGKARPWCCFGFCFGEVRPWVVD